MTKYKIYRISGYGQVTIEIVEAFDWMQLFSMFQFSGNPIFKAEVVGGQEPINNEM